MVRVGFWFPCQCLDIVQIDQTSLIYTFHISLLGDLVHSLDVLSPPNPLWGDGTGRT